MHHVSGVNESCRTYGRVMAHIWTNYVVHLQESCQTHTMMYLKIKERKRCRDVSKTRCQHLLFFYDRLRLPNPCIFGCNRCFNLIDCYFSLHPIRSDPKMQIFGREANKAAFSKIQPTIASKNARLERWINKAVAFLDEDRLRIHGRSDYEWYWFAIMFSAFIASERQWNSLITCLQVLSTHGFDEPVNTTS